MFQRENIIMSIFKKQEYPGKKSGPISMRFSSFTFSKIGSWCCFISALFFSVAAGLFRTIFFILIFLTLAAMCILTGVYLMRKK